MGRRRVCTGTLSANWCKAKQEEAPSVPRFRV